MGASRYYGSIGKRAVALGVVIAILTSQDFTAAWPVTSSSAATGLSRTRNSACADDVDDVPVTATLQSAKHSSSGSIEGNSSRGVDPAELHADSRDQTSVHTPIYNMVRAWTKSSVGQAIADFVNTLLGSHAIGDGAAGTDASHPNGTDGGWLFGDGGAGWNSTVTGVAGGNGGAGGFFGDGGNGGSGGPGAVGGNGGAGGRYTGIGGRGGDGGAGTGDRAGGAGGTGGDAKGLMWPVGGAGGKGGAGSGQGAGGAGGPGGAAHGLLFSTGGLGGNGSDGGDGGVGGDGGNATGFLACGGRGGNGGDGSLTGPLPALGGAGGTTTQWFGNHGANGLAGIQSGVRLAPRHSKFNTTGRWFTDNDGKVITFRGMNVVDIRDPIRPPSAEGFDDDDADFFAANGFNVVRLGVDWELLQPRPGVYDDTYLNSLGQTVQLLAGRGIVSLLDLHRNVPPSYATGDLPPSSLPFPASVFFDSAKNAVIDRFWANEKGPTGAGQLNEYAKMVQYLAHHFNGNPDILGIEIMNEPLPGNQFVPSILSSSYHEAQQLTPFYNQVAAAIRSVNPDVTIFFEPSVLASATVPVRLSTIRDSNTALSFHDYGYVNLNGRVLPDVKDIAGTANAYAEAHNIPAMMTEFGSSNNSSSLDQTLRPADQYLLGWTEWSYANTGYLGVDGTVEWLVDDPSKPLTGHNVNHSSLETLTRPYAQVVAGTPTAMSLGDNDTFRFGYTTERADGRGRFATGSQTTLSVPRAHYPNGYHVTVEGGRVVSAPNAPKLVIASDNATTTVTVTITPIG